MNAKKIEAIYGKNWALIANKIKAKAGYKCQDKHCTCLKKGKNILTVHHRDGCPRHKEDSNLEALCKICHLRKQKFLEPCYLLMYWKAGMSKIEMENLYHGCTRNRQAISGII